MTENSEAVEGEVVTTDGGEEHALPDDRPPAENEPAGELIRRTESELLKPASERDYRIAIELGHVLARSNYFSDAKDPARAAVKVMAGMELGFGPVASLTGVHILDPDDQSPSIMIGGQMLNALVARSGRYRVEILTRTAEECELRFYDDGEPCEPTVTWTLEDAKRAGLQSRKNWQKYPRQMLFWRALSEGVDLHCPELTSGAPVYTGDELTADVDAESGSLAGALEPPKPSVPAPLDDDEAKQKMDRARELKDEISKINERLLTPAMFNRLLTQSSHDHSRLDDLLAHLEDLLAQETKIRAKMDELIERDADAAEKLARESRGGSQADRLREVEDALSGVESGS